MKKPASAAQTITPVPRAELTAAALTCANGKMTLDKKYEVYNAASNKWGGAPKVTASGEFDIRLKPTAKSMRRVKMASCQRRLYRKGFNLWTSWPEVTVFKAGGDCRPLLDDHSINILCAGVDFGPVFVLIYRGTFCEAHFGPTWPEVRCGKRRPILMAQGRRAIKLFLKTALSNASFLS